ncbi:MAG: hypothetical protein Q8K63_00485 [Acidimicrobiales bacterium]|nr:hypothetical protein [Acidimicrobiales bacterium]
MKGVECDGLAERLGDTFTASDRWRDCSEAWHQVADKTRAQQALARSQRTFRGTNPRTQRGRGVAQQPLASDYL